MTSTVRIDDVSHRFGNFTALDHIDLTIESGRFAVLLGPSGCGKTTLLSVLGGFISPSSGRVLLNHKDVTHVAPAMRPTTTMFQDYALFPHMTLIDNVGFGLRMRGQSRSRRHKAARELLQLVGLDQEWKKKPHELSGGQRQRVALARALAVEPEVLLLDEPLGALDLNLRRQMQDELKAIQKRVGTTFVHVTHDQEEAMAIADDIIVMNAGRVEDHGSPESIYLSPRSLFSASFMGEANMIFGTVLEHAGQRMSVQTPEAVWQMPPAAAGLHAFAKGERVGVCFRPEHIVELSAVMHGSRQGGEVDTQPPVQNDDMMHLVQLGSVILQEHAFFGTHQRCQVRTADDQSLIVNLPQDRVLENGQVLVLAIKASALVVLPAEDHASSPFT